MDNGSLLVAAMAEQAKALIQKSKAADSHLPQALHPQHLLWMCDQIAMHAEEWPATKLHRWLGFVQGAMMANRMLDFKGAKAMFDDAKDSYGGCDDDLVDHLDPNSSFELELGGES